MAMERGLGRTRIRDIQKAGRVLLLISSIAVFLAPSLVMAADPSERRAGKTYWQTRYLSLLTKAEALRGTIEQERELYADANRRNYRRGTKRHGHREAMEKAASELVRVDAELAGLKDEGRRAGALPGWFYEIDMEREDADRRPAISAGPGNEGRNPLYVDGPREKD